MIQVKVLVAAVAALGACLAQGADFNVEGRDGAAVQKAIDAAAAAGGGRVVVPAGIYPSKSLRLRSRVELHLMKDALIQGGTNASDYSSLPVSESRIGRAFIQAWDAQDIAITGEGAIDGNGRAFFDIARGATKWGRYYHPKPGRALLVGMWNCKGVKFRGVKFLNSSVWTMRLRRCENLDFEGITVKNDLRFYNGDGIDFDSCRHVRLRNSDFLTGDDCIVLRAIREKGDVGKFVCEDVEVSDCNLESGCQCVRVGCPSDDTIRNCRFRNIRMKGWNGIFFEFPHFYLRQDEDGYANVHDITFENVTGALDNNAAQIVVGDGIKIRGVRDVMFRNFDVRSKLPLNFVGNVYSPVVRIRRENFTLNGERLPDGEFEAPCTNAKPLRRRQPGEYNYKKPEPYVRQLYVTVGDQTGEAVQQAIDAVAKNATGGVVLVPEGTYAGDRLELRSRVELRLARGARILLGKTGLVSAVGLQDVALTGEGEIVGAGPSGTDAQVKFLRCTGVRVDGIALDRKQMLDIASCEDVTTGGLRFR